MLWTIFFWHTRTEVKKGKESKKLMIAVEGQWSGGETALRKACEIEEGGRGLYETTTSCCFGEKLKRLAT